MTQFLLAIAVAAGWAVSLYFWPFRDCRRCRGSGRNRGSNRRRYGTCKGRRCQRGTVQRFGSKAVHRAARALVAYRKGKW